MIRALSTIILFACWLSCFGQSQSGRPMVSVDTVADLVARNPVPNERVLLSGLRTAGDYGSQRIVRHVPGSTAQTNLGCVFYSASGRYLAEDCDGGETDVRWWGAVGDGSTDDSAAFQAVFDADYRTVTVPQGLTFKFTGRLTKTNITEGFTLRLLGTMRHADGASDHQIIIGSIPTFTNGYPDPYPYTNIVVDGGNTGILDGNAGNSAEYFPTSTLAAYGGHSLYILGARGVQVKGLTVKDAPIYAIAIRGCRDVQVIGNTVDTGYGNNSTNYNGKNQDGIHLIDVVDGLVQGNRVHSSDDNVAVTTLGGISERVTIQGNVLEHNYFTNASGLVGTFATLGSNVRLTAEVDASTYVRDVLVVNNLMFGGNAGINMQHSLTGSNFLRNAVIRGNRIFNKTNEGIAAYPCRYAIIGTRYNGVTIVENEFDNIARQLYFQDGYNLEITGNRFSHELTNSLIVPQCTIRFDGANSQAPSGGIRISGNTFRDTVATVLRVDGAKTGQGPMYSDLEFTGNTARNGPSDDGYVVLIDKVGGLIDVSRNIISDWDDTTIWVDNCPLGATINDNRIFNQGLTAARTYAIFHNNTNGFLSDAVDVSRNSVRTAGGGIEVRNARVVRFDGNELTDTQKNNYTQTSLAWAIIGDSGTTPDLSGVVGSITGNWITGTNNNAVKAVLVDTPTYNGSRIYMRGNEWSGYSTPVAPTTDTKMLPSVDYEVFRSVIGTETPASFGSHWRFLESGDGGQSFWVERYSLKNSGHSAAPFGMAVTHRFQGVGTNFVPVYGIYSGALSYRTNDINLLRGLGGIGALTAAGGAAEVSGVYGEISSSGGAKIGNAYGLIAGSIALSGGSTATNGGGLYIYEQTSASIANKYAIRQVGSGNSNVLDGPLYVGGNTVWNAGNDGAGSGLDADRVQGLAYPTNNGAFVLFITNGVASWIAHP